MCGRMTLLQNAQSSAQTFDVALKHEGVENFPLRYNIAPTQPIVIIRNESNMCAMGLARWGLVPGWVKEPQNFSLLINARSETVLEKPSFRGAMRHRRCLIPASGYYEWRSEAHGKQPYYIQPKTGQIMAFAGLWEEWTGPEGEVIESAAILTQSAQPDLAQIHHRMPVVLEAGNYAAWLNVQETDAKAAHALLPPVADDFYDITPVGLGVNHAREEGAELIAPLENIQQASSPQQMVLL